MSSNFFQSFEVIVWKGTRNLLCGRR